MTIYHCCFDLASIIHRGGAKEMAGHVRLPGADQWATEDEIITHAAILQAKGLEVMPTCSNHDARGYCRGHEDQQR